MIIRNSKSAPTTAIVLLFALAAVAIGGLTALLPWYLTVALVVGPIFLLFAGNFPHYATAIAVFLAFGAVPSFLLPQIPFAGGIIRASELFLAFITGIILIKILTGKPTDRERLSSDFTPGLLLITLLTSTSLVAAVALGNNPKYYLYELRSLLFWLVFPLILFTINSQTKTKRFTTILLLMGLILAVGVIIQFTTGTKVLEASRVEKLITTGAIYSDVTRSTAGGGIYFILFLINCCFVLWVKGKMSWILALPLMLTGSLATLATFGRGVWFAEACAVFFILLLLKGKERTKGLVAMLGALAIGLASLFTFAPHVAEATIDRLTSVGDELKEGESIQWRKEENKFAREAIIANPIVGVGLGGEYQPFRDRNMGEDHTRAIHNSYYFLMLKFGVIGITIPFVMGLAAFSAWRKSSNTQESTWNSGVATAAAGTLTTIYITSFTQPEWMHHTGVAFFATMFALLVLLHRFKDTDADGTRE